MRKNTKNPHKGLLPLSGVKKRDVNTSLNEKLQTTLNEESLTNLTNLGQLEEEERRQVEIDRLLKEDSNEFQQVPILTQPYSLEINRLTQLLAQTKKPESRDESEDAQPDSEWTKIRNQISTIHSQISQIEQSFLTRQEIRQKQIRELRILSQKFMLDYPDKKSFLELQILKLVEEYSQAKPLIDAAYIQAKEKWRKYPYLRNQIFTIEVIRNLFPNPKTSSRTTNIEKASFAIASYTDQGKNDAIARYLNDLDRETDVETKELISSLNLMFSYIDPLMHDIAVYRGIRPPDGVTLTLDQVALSHKSYLSTSMFKSEAKSYAFNGREDLVIPIIIKQDSKILPVGVFSDDTSGEILLGQYSYRKFYKSPGSDKYVYETAVYSPYVEFVEDVKKHLDFRYPKTIGLVAWLYNMGWGMMGRGGRIKKLKTHKNRKHKTKKNKKNKSQR